MSRISKIRVVKPRRFAAEFPVVRFVVALLGIWITDSLNH